MAGFAVRNPTRKRDHPAQVSGLSLDQLKPLRRIFAHAMRGGFVPPR